MLRTYSRFSVFLLLWSSASFAEARLRYPQVHFEYGIFDVICHSSETHPITEQMTNELLETLPKVQDEWNTEAPQLLEGAVALIERGFTHKELVATMILCAGIPPMSSPLMINMRPYLNSSNQSTPLPRFYLMSTVFHELLHRLLVDNYSESLFPRSALIEKYQWNCGLDNCDTVLSHIHLMAILKSVYLRLGRADELRQIIEMDSKIPNPGYRRSWEIVNQEGEDVFIRELRSL